MNKEIIVIGDTSRDRVYPAIGHIDHGKSCMTSKEEIVVIEKAQSLGSSEVLNPLAQTEPFIITPYNFTSSVEMESPKKKNKKVPYRKNNSYF